MHWARIEDASFVGGMRFMLWVYHHGGEWPFRVLLYLVVPWYFFSNGVGRRASREYLARLYEASGGKTPPPTWRNVFRHFMNFSETLLDKLLATDPELAWTRPYTTEGIEYYNRLLDEGRGAVVITAHLGNLSLCRRLAHEHRTDVRLTLLVHSKNAERFHNLLKSIDPGQSIETLQVDSVDVRTAMLLSQRISAGGFVFIAGDRVPVTPGGSTLPATFLGKTAHFPIGPYVLAAALACPVFMMFSARRDAGFNVFVRPLAERIVLPRKAREAAIRPWLDAFVSTLAEQCRKHPLQWFNFYPFWHTPTDDEKSA
jgi:predicted LPLAT superfamily acyltransferase